ncbi:MAG: hypothetical protein EA380_10430 [Phycisphaeraceae bacterium]|nr:MAG: hypothetical protein EA380_10430 [Phycisphaeraceae bacterium]
MLSEIPGTRQYSGRLLVRPLQTPGRVNPALRDLVALQQDHAARMRIADRVIEHVGVIDEYMIRVPGGFNDSEYAASLIATGDYEYVEPDWIVSLANSPNDPLLWRQWQHDAIRSYEAWSISTGSDLIICAVCDTGVDLNHPDLAPALVPGANSVGQIRRQGFGGAVNDINGHGTFVAGCMAAIGDNGVGVVGGAWSSRIMPIRVSDLSSGNAAMSDILRGARWAAENGAQVINASYSGVQSAAVGVTGEYIAQQGGLLFWAAGNDNQQMSGFHHEWVMVIGATNSNDNKANFSNYGTPIDLTAPGASVYSTQRGGGYGFSSGTSFASPIAAGVAALVWGANRGLTPEQVRDILTSTARDRGAPGKDPIFGHGIVHAGDAVALAVTIDTPEPPPPPPPPPPPAPPGPFDAVYPAPGVSPIPADEFVLFEWTVSADAQSYRVEIATRADFVPSSLVFPILDRSSPSLTIFPGALASASEYFMRVTAVSAGGELVWEPGIVQFSMEGAGCFGDITGDGSVGLDDFIVLSANFGTETELGRSAGDLNGDGVVDLDDFALLAADFGCSR